MWNGSNPPEWLTALSWVSIILSLATAVGIGAHILAGNRQKMMVMNFVWPITGLYFGPLGVLPYLRFGVRGGSGKKPLWQSAFTGDTHCGAGCTLGDFAGEWIVFATGLTFAGSVLWASVTVDFALAYALGLIFQYWAIAPMRNISGWKGLKAAAKADSLSLISFEAGMVAWMALSSGVLFHPRLQPDQAPYWFSMQIAMICGFAAAYPVNIWLIRAGVKEAM